MIGIRFDPLTERWLVSLLAIDGGAMDLPLAFKATEADAVTFASCYAAQSTEVRRVNVDPTRYALDLECLCDEIQGADPRRHFKGCPLRAEVELDARGKTIEAISVACEVLDHGELVQLARTAARLVTAHERAGASDER